MAPARFGKSLDNTASPHWWPMRKAAKLIEMARLPLSIDRIRPLGLALAVAVVLADSSVVILALPAILNEYHVEIPSVAWVLTAFNLVLALSAVPVAYLARRAPRNVLLTGLVVFAAASAACALADGFGPLLVARCVQAVGGAAIVCAALEVMPALVGPGKDATRTWAMAGAIGLALGPALGGALTQLLSWRAIFIAQVPVLLVVGLVAHVHVRPSQEAAGRPRIGANLALACVSASLTAALFLLVLLLINGWGMRPLSAAVTVSVMPLAAIAAARLRVFHVGVLARAASGAVATAAGVGALGLLPRAGVVWTLGPQILVGLGLGLSVGALTEAALAQRPQLAIHGGWTVASRHVGVVAGILLLTPIFVADFDRQQVLGQDAVLAITLDAPVDMTTKLQLMRQGAVVVEQAVERIPDLAPVFDAITPSAADRADYNALEDRLNDELRRNSSAAVVRSFLFAALFGLIALFPILLARRRSEL